MIISFINLRQINSLFDRRLTEVINNTVGVTSKELIDSTQVAQMFAKKIQFCLTQEQQNCLAVVLLNTLNTAQIPLSQINQEINAILRGVIGVNSLGEKLEITNSQIATLKNSSNNVEEYLLLKLLSYGI